MATTTSKPLADNDKCDHFEEDGCPVHGGEPKKTYSFGRDRYVPDAEVFVFTRCRCAVAVQYDPCGILQYSPRYFTSYQAAAGLANLVKAEYAAKWHSAL